MSAYLDPDFRRAAPKTDLFCVRCQKDIADVTKALSVVVDWDAWVVTKSQGGEELIGRDCAKKIGLIS